MRRRSTWPILVGMAFLLALLVFACGGGGDDVDGDTSDGDGVDSDGDDTDGDDGDVDDAPVDGDDGDVDDAPVDGDDGDVDVDQEPDADGDTDTDEIDGELSDAELVITPDPIDFGLVPIRQISDLDVTIENISDTDSPDVTITSVEWLASSSSALRLAADCSPPFVLEPGDEVSCGLICEPQNAGRHDGGLRVVGHDAEGGILDLRIDVNCGVGLPVLYADPMPLNFGFVEPGQTAWLPVAIGNAGNAVLNLNAVSLHDDSDSAFSLSDDFESGEYLPSEGAVVEVAFAPSETGPVVGWLVVESDDPAAPERVIAISGRGAEECPEGWMDADGICVEICLPGLRRCTDGVPELCDADGLAWDEEAACEGGRFCERGYCVWALCAPETSFCRDGAYVDCVAEGDDVENADDCDDGKFCTQNRCTPGIGCQNPKDVRPCDDGQVCTDEDCSEIRGCFYPFNTADCNDEDPCTQADRCVRGQCVGAVDDCDDGKPCTADTCDPQTGCAHTPIEGVCNDRDACTENDRCEAGECVGDTRVCDDGNACTRNECDAVRGCIYPAKNEACDDGNPCTGGDSCSSGSCRGSLADPSDGLFCNGPEVCDPESGVSSPYPVGCNDGIACTVDSCQEGTNRAECVHTPNDLACEDNNPCTSPDECVPGQGCSHQAVADNSPCDLIPGITEICLDGQCVAPCDTDADCRDFIDCTYDYCDESSGYCRHESRSDICDDGQWCNGVEICDVLFGCRNGDPIDCADPFNCTADACDELNDRCVHESRDLLCDDFNLCTADVCRAGEGCVFLPVEGSCDDGDPCTLLDRCSGGVCGASGVRLVCEDGNPCTYERCVAGVGCVSEYASGSCDDGQFCTDPDICIEGVCVGEPRDCDDGQTCTGDEICTEEEGCVSNGDISCDDGVACTQDHCADDLFGCEFTPIHERCEDNNPCTIEDLCTLEGCTYVLAEDNTGCGNNLLGPMVCLDGYCAAKCNNDNDCDDEIDCTEDTCNTAIGRCVHTAVDDRCFDTNWCDGEESCHPTLGCLDGEPIDCDDETNCTLDECDNELQDCTHTPDDGACVSATVCRAGYCTENDCAYVNVEGACNDADPCTVGDTCVSGRCVGTPFDCDDGNPCTAGACTASGCVFTALADYTACGDPGGLPRLCLAGVCVASCLGDGDCDDGVGCTVDFCNPVTLTCEHRDADELCDDGLLCNGVETCDPVQGCLAGEAVVCEDAIACTHNYCNESTGDCEIDYLDAECEDGNPCTDEVCTEAGCESEPNFNVCDDGNLCTTDDACDAQGDCVGEELDCTDGSVCTSDFCHPLIGCYYQDNPAACSTTNVCRRASCDDGQCLVSDLAGPCDDGLRCTVGEACATGACRSGWALDCDDHNPCTNDGCSEAGGCTHTPVADGGSCNLWGIGLESVCQAGFCVLRNCQVDSDCDDGVACSAETCNSATGRCEYVPDHGACDDGLVCTGSEICAPFVGCISDQEVDCDDGIACTRDRCDEGQGGCVHDAENLACDDGEFCTADVCNPSTGCESTLLSGLACDDGDPCSVNDTCTEGVCGGVARDCNDDNPCTDPDECSPLWGCLNTPVSDGAACDNDGVCISGQCAGACLLDADCDDGVACTVDVCDPIWGRCRYLADNALCDDGAYCNGVETCHLAFGCQAGRPIDCNDGVPCTEDRCDEESRQCLFTPNDQLCDDGNPCSDVTCDPDAGCVRHFLNDELCATGDLCAPEGLCANGICIPGDPIDCGEETPCLWNGCHPAIGCFSHFRNNAGNCAEDDICAYEGSCVNGTCEITVPVDCNDQNPCTEDLCNPFGDPQQPCQHNSRNGESCNDNNACTTGDVCAGIFCGGTTIDCDDDDPCTVETGCSSTSGCQYGHAEDGTSCEIAEVGPGVCADGICVRECQVPGDCDDGLTCTEDTCEEGVCQHSLQCPDGNFCEGPASCTAQGCVYIDPPDCDDGLACTVDRCDVGTDACVHDPMHETCNDDNVCTTDICWPPYGCVNEKQTGDACDDGDPCTAQSVCMAGFCVGSGAVDCNDFNPCTADSCTAEESCLHEPLTGTACDDGDPCSSDDRCQAGVCAGDPRLCESDNPCMAAACDPTGRCVLTPLTGIACESDNLCAAAAQCLDGVCTVTETIVCDDADPCTVDVCLAESGCTGIKVNGLPCDDENVCTVGDVCVDGMCEEGALELDCEDGNPCTIDTCAVGTGCTRQNAPDESACDLIPNVPEACIDGACIPYCTTAGQCNDKIVCTVDTCDSESHLCVNTPDDLSCDDGNACNGLENCVVGSGCQAGEPVVCDDEIDCTDDLCDPSSGDCIAVPQDFLCDDGVVCTENTCDEETGCQLILRHDRCDDDDVCTDDACDAVSGCTNVDNGTCAP